MHSTSAESKYGSQVAPDAASGEKVGERRYRAQIERNGRFESVLSWLNQLPSSIVCFKVNEIVYSEAFFRSDASWALAAVLIT